MNKLITYIQKNTYFAIIFGFIGTIGIIEYLNIVYGIKISYNFIAIVFFVLLANLYYKMPRLKKRENIFGLGITFTLSIIFILGSQLDNYSAIIWSLATFVKIIMLSFAIFPMISYLINFINKISIKRHINISKKNHVIVFVIISAFNFLGFFALYPGVYGYDAGFQILEVLDPSVKLTSHFSIIYSFFLAQCINVGKTIFHNNTIGLAIYSLIQMLFMNYVATRITFFSYNLSKNRLILFISILMFSIFPLYIVMVFSTAQDVIFSGLFALLIINFIEYYDNPLNNKAIMIGFITLLLCLFRNNGYYAIIFFLIVSFFIKPKKPYYLLLISIFCSVVIYNLFVGSGYRLLHIVKESPIREMSSVPSQQFSRTYNYNIDNLSKKEIREYEHFYDLKYFSYYSTRQSISDSSKMGLKVKVVEEKPIEYLLFWLKTGVEHPKLYIEAFLLNNLGSWYPSKYYNDNRMYHPYIEYEMLDAKLYNPKYEVIQRESKLPFYNNWLKKVVYYTSWQSLPVFSFVFSIGFYFVLYLFTLGMCIINKKRKFYFPLILIGGLYITILLAPVSLFRYSFPIILCSPILLSMIITKEKKEK